MQYAANFTAPEIDNFQKRFFFSCFCSKRRYEGQSRINDNEFISLKVLSDSVLFVMSYEDTYITYSCLKFLAFAMARFNAMII